MNIYEKGKMVKGRVSGVKDYGIFVSFDNKRSGMIHISEISHNYVRNINDFIDVGQDIFAIIINDQPKQNFFKLSIKDINFKTGGKNHIEENGEGIKLLQQNMDVWIENKLNEIKEEEDI